MGIDRQDGDELSREQIVEYVRELNTIAAECEVAGTAELSRAAHNLYRIARQWFKSLQSRDAAEGAGEHPNLKAGMAGLRASRAPAPPKPAPDAMRSLANKLQEIRRDLGGFDYAAVEEHIAERLLAAGYSAAPVPSPDGAAMPDIEGIRWQRVNSEPFEYAIQQGPCGDTFVKLLNGLCLRRLLPSGAGAAEPYIPDDQVELGIGNYAKRQKVATPPVRGDREILERCAKIARRFKYSEETKAATNGARTYGNDEACEKIADAILSLPVQSTIDKTAAAQIIATRILNSKLEHLEGPMRDGIRDVVTEILELAGVQSDAGEREAFNRNDVVRLVLAARAVAFGDDHGGEAGMRELDSASEQFAASIPWASIPWDDQPEEQQ